MFHSLTHDARASAVLTPEQSAAIFQKDLANIIAKTRDGKPLTATERRVLRSVPDGITICDPNRDGEGVAKVFQRI